MWIPFRKKKEFFTESQKEQVVKAIREAEHQTSGEVRVFVESRCRFVDPVDRAYEIFKGLKMEETHHRNGVIVYVALKDRQLAVYGDIGIHEKTGEIYWKMEVAKMLSHFNNEDYITGISTCVREIGQALHEHFPYDRTEDKNELPDEIVFGK